MLYQSASLFAFDSSFLRQFPRGEFYSQCPRLSVAAACAAVLDKLDDERLAKLPRNLVKHDARHGIGSVSCRERADHLDRSRGPLLRT
jgi:hypothetical protein